MGASCTKGSHPEDTQQQMHGIALSADAHRLAAAGSGEPNINRINSTNPLHPDADLEESILPPHRRRHPSQSRSQEEHQTPPIGVGATANNTSSDAAKNAASPGLGSATTTTDGTPLSVLIPRRHRHSRSHRSITVAMRSRDAYEAPQPTSREHLERIRCLGEIADLHGLTADPDQFAAGPPPAEVVHESVAKTREWLATSSDSNFAAFA